MCLKDVAFENADRDKKCDARKVMLYFFEHLQNEKFINSFQLSKKVPLRTPSRLHDKTQKLELILSRKFEKQPALSFRFISDIH